MNPKNLLHHCLGNWVLGISNLQHHHLNLHSKTFIWNCIVLSLTKQMRQEYNGSMSEQTQEIVKI